MPTKLTSLFFVASVLIFLSGGELAAQIPQSTILWFRSDTGVTAENGTVSDWKSQTLPPKSAFQSLPISQPTFLPDTINHLPAIHFNPAHYNFMYGPPIFPIQP